MSPADEGLRPHHPPGAQVHLGLVVQQELAAVQGLVELAFEREPLHGGLAHGLLVAHGKVAVLLGPVHGGLGVAVERHRLVAVRGKDGVADARRDEELVALDLKGLAKGRHEITCQAHRLLGPRKPGPDDGERVAPDPGDVVGGAEGPQEALGDLADQQVAGAVAEGVVDDLEAIEIQQQQAGLVPGALGLGQDLAQPVLEEAAVRKAGQGVGARQALEGRAVLLAQGPLKAGGEGRKLRAQRLPQDLGVGRRTQALHQALDMPLE
ncbi:hypothetical protein D3C87_1376700 [compost metagenome]